MRHTLSAALFLLLASAATSAQTEPPPHSAHQVVSVNPFGIVVKWFNVEYERKVAPAVTLGGSASYDRELDQSDAIAMVRWYPQQRALDGVYLGVRAGAYGVRSYTYELRTYRARDVVVPAAGIELGYNWLLGPSQNVSIGTGFALTRLAGGTGSYYAPSVIPGFRLNVGFAF
jgi:uncharacterized protein DUF3575